MNGNGPLYGLYNTSAPYTKYYHNSITFDNSASTSGSAYGIYQTGATTGLEYFNNIVSITRAGTGTKRCIQFGTATTGNTSNNNVFYLNASAGTSNHIGEYASTDCLTLSDWQAVNSNALDQQSVSCSKRQDW